MPATTAQILIGNPHPNDGGITAIHTMTLTEGGRPAWILRPSSRFAQGSRREMIWIPTVERMLDDALLMAAIHAFESEPVRAMFSRFSDKIDENRLELYEDLRKEERHQLYQLCRELDDFPKIVLTVFDGSSISSQTGALADYRMECEVLMSVYNRSYSRWTQQTTIKGKLPPVETRDRETPDPRSTWFYEMTGIEETDYESTRAQLRVEGERLYSLTNHRSWEIGRLETPSLAELRVHAAPALAATRGRLSVRAVSADLYRMHARRQLEKALVQVESQFNLLDLPGYRSIPEDGVSNNRNDRTCACATAAGLIYRNYFAPVEVQVGETRELEGGQTRTRQIDTLADLRAALPGGDGISMRNGYALADVRTLHTIRAALESASAAEIDALRARLRIGLHWDMETTASETARPQYLQRVSHAYCSALPISSNRDSDPKLWQAFARLVLEAAYEATLLAGLINAAREGGSNSVYLTLPGAGNRREWSIDAIRRVLDLVRDQALEVRLVNYGSVPDDLRALAAEYDHQQQA